MLQSETSVYLITKECKTTTTNCQPTIKSLMTASLLWTSCSKWRISSIKSLLLRSNKLAYKIKDKKLYSLNSNLMEINMLVLNEVNLILETYAFLSTMNAHVLFIQNNNMHISIVTHNNYSF